MPFHKQILRVEPERGGFLIRPLEICPYQIRNICGSILLRDGKEIGGSGMSAAVAGGVILEEAQEVIRAHAPA